MRRHISPVVAGAVVASGCTGRVPRHFEVPEDAKNPSEIGFRGATAAEMVDLVVQVCAQIPIGMGYIDRKESYAETDWIDLGMFEVGWDLSSYRGQYRLVVYVFQVGMTGKEEGVLRFTGWYQPDRPLSAVSAPHYDRHIPTDHPGYQLMLQWVYRLRLASVEKNIEIMAP